MLNLDTPIHPGEILRQEYLAPLGLKPYTLAKKLHVPRTRIERLTHKATPVTLDTALRLAKFFGTTPQFWMNMQASYDLAVQGRAEQAEIAEIEQLKVAG
ncbi:HigA family addiction module antitoxin [Mesorhizobium sp. ISC25]|uniref:HigA family addiction module antitoxin n=1 Tax=Mesorhizobium sp. ISC25 TaxID=3077335 RepID=UPI0035E136F2